MAYGQDSTYSGKATQQTHAHENVAVDLSWGATLNNVDLQGKDPENLKHGPSTPLGRLNRQCALVTKPHDGARTVRCVKAVLVSLTRKRHSRTTLLSGEFGTKVTDRLPTQIQ